jgi:hypothetical protein
MMVSMRRHNRSKTTISLNPTGTGPDAFFWVGSSPRPSPEGYIIPYPEEFSGRLVSLSLTLFPVDKT